MNWRGNAVLIYLTSMTRLPARNRFQACELSITFLKHIGWSRLCEIGCSLNTVTLQSHHWTCNRCACNSIRGSHELILDLNAHCRLMGLDSSDFQKLCSIYGLTTGREQASDQRLLHLKLFVSSHPQRLHFVACLSVGSSQVFTYCLAMPPNDQVPRMKFWTPF